MQPQANLNSLDSHPWHRAGQASTADLLAELGPHAGKALVFNYEGRDVQAGYTSPRSRTGALPRSTAARRRKPGARR